MRQLLTAATILLMMLLGAQLPAQEPAPDAAELTKMLNDFLAGASRNDAETHDKFWAEDLIYTGSSGRRVGKDDIMKDVRSAPPAKPDELTTVYTAEDVRIQQYGTTAVVAFRLVATAGSDGKKDVSNYLNSGTFLKRNGKWQVVNWQATRLPRPEEEARKEAADAEGVMNHALLAADTKALEQLVDENFVWTQDDGTQKSRKQLLEDLSSGQLKYSRLETQNPTVNVYGDTAIIRGLTTRQRSASPGSKTGDSAPFTAYYTLSLVRIDALWKAVALHTSKN